MSGIIHKVKDALTGGDKHHDDTTHSGHHTTGTTGTTGTHHTTAGPHSTDIANRADPRVDSDRDGRTGLTGATGSGLTETGHHTTGTGLTGAGHHTHGPHSSDLANRADPRVDSDGDGRTGLTGTGHHTTGTGLTGSGLTGSGHHTTGTGLTGSGLTGSGHHTTGTGLTGSGHHTYGPHSSDLANKADPRVDSDGDRHRGLGSTGNTTTTGNLPLGATPQGLVHGHHTTVTGEKLDPHVSGQTTGISSGITTGTTGTTNTTGTHSGTSGTTGPHNSSLLNKLDPRVNS